MDLIAIQLITLSSASSQAKHLQLLDFLLDFLDLTSMKAWKASSWYLRQKPIQFKYHKPSSEELLKVAVFPSTIFPFLGSLSDFLGFLAT